MPKKVNLVVGPSVFSSARGTPSSPHTSLINARVPTRNHRCNAIHQLRHRRFRSTTQETNNGSTKRRLQQDFLHSHTEQIDSRLATQEADCPIVRMIVIRVFYFLYSREMRIRQKPNDNLAFKTQNKQNFKLNHVLELVQDTLLQVQDD